MEENGNSRQKVTRTLLATSLVICAGLFMLLVFGSISSMKEGGDNYFRNVFTRDGGIKSFLNTVKSGEQQGAVAVSTTAGPDLVQEQPAFEAAGEAKDAEGPMTAEAQDGIPASSDGMPLLERPYTDGAETAALPQGQGQGRAGTATAAAISANAPSGSSKQPAGAQAALPPGAGDNDIQGPPRAWPAARLSIDGILAAAGIIRTANSVLSATGAHGKGTMFTPERVLSLGGRLGQGTVSMESGSGARGDNFDLNAQGLSADLGPEAAGPKIPAGKAPAVPSGHVAYIVEAARAEGIDPALLAATAARESNFGPKAYRAEPHLKQVQWRAAPGSPLKSYYDGSIGPTQVLRSNFLAQGIDNDVDAYNLKNNYRVSSRIIKSNISYFPGNTWKAVAAYNVGKYGAKSGRVPANNYTDTIITWRGEYKKALGPYQ